MHVKVPGLGEASVTAPQPSPMIRVSQEEIGDRWSLGAATIEVENERGELARFWVNVRVKRGRPVVYLSTKIGKDDERTGQTKKQIEKKVQGTFNLI